jgi:serine/threonine-protein kinase HipA
MRNKVIHVFYHGYKVGRIAMVDPYTCAFEYDGGWLSDGFTISPFKLPLEKKVFIAPHEPFGGSFGVFEDSLPDGWGRLLVDRMLRQKGIEPAEVSVLDRLAIVGRNGMGALEYRPEEVLVSTEGDSQSNIETLAEEIEAILQEREYTRQSLAELVKLGGSSGGARPKVLLKIDGEDWIVKFRASSDPPTIGQQEYEYAQKARAAGRFLSLDYVDFLNAALRLTRDYGKGGADYLTEAHPAVFNTAIFMVSRYTPKFYFIGHRAREESFSLFHHWVKVTKRITP